MRYNALREKSTFKKKESKTAVVEKRGGCVAGVRRDDRSGTKSRSKGAEGFETGFGQPMLPAGQRDKRPRKNHIMPESRGTLSGNTSGSYYMFFVKLRPPVKVPGNRRERG